MYEPELNKERAYNPISFDIWIAWIAATGVAVAGITVFFYMNFQTKDAFADYRNERSRQDESLIKRLDRIEDKIDRLLSK